MPFGYAIRNFQSKLDNQNLQPSWSGASRRASSSRLFTKAKAPSSSDRTSSGPALRGGLSGNLIVTRNRSMLMGDNGGMLLVCMVGRFCVLTNEKFAGRKQTCLKFRSGRAECTGLVPHNIHQGTASVVLGQRATYHRTCHWWQLLSERSMVTGQRATHPGPIA